MNADTRQRAFVQELQQYLRVISFSDNRVPPIAVDGVFGPETTRAVEAFQSAYRMPVTGKVDREDWEAIVEVYREAILFYRTPLSIVPLRQGENLHEGDSGETVFILQSVLKSIAYLYTNIPETVINGVYDPLTAEAVREFQRMALLPQNGITDADTWDRLAQVYNVRPQ